MDPAATSSVTSLTLLERARQRDPAAWRMICELYAPLVYGWVRKSGVVNDEAPDVVQNVFCVVATHLDRFRHDRQGDTFRGWLITLTRNEVRGYFRKRGRQSVIAEGGSAANVRIHQVPDPLPDDSSDDDVAPSSERREFVRRSAELVRGDFAPQTWQAFWRSVVEGHEPADIARDLNMTANAIRQARFRVLKRLREFLQEWG